MRFPTKEVLLSAAVLCALGSLGLAQTPPRTQPTKTVRVVPNFVIQGGSPGANEYWGDGPYTRDELTTEEHLRGTVGISTRGRDTGDGYAL